MRFTALYRQLARIQCQYCRCKAGQGHTREVNTDAAAQQLPDNLCEMYIAGNEGTNQNLIDSSLCA